MGKLVARAKERERRNEDGVRDKLEVTRRYYTRRDSPYLCFEGEREDAAQKDPRRERERQGGTERDRKWDTAGAVERWRALVEVAAMRWKVVEEEEEEKKKDTKRDAGETEERFSGDSMRGEPYVEERASQIGPLALLVARKAGSC